MPEFVAFHIRQERHAILARRFSHAGFLPDQEDLHLRSQVLPGLDGVALDDVDVRVGEGFGGGEYGQEAMIQR